MITPQTAENGSLRSMLLALSGFAMLSIGDGVVKTTAGHFPGSEMALLRYLFGAFGLALAMQFTYPKVRITCPQPWLQLARGAAVGAAALFFFTAIHYMPLADANAIQFTAPLITALLSAFVLKEAAPRALWIACPLAFVGVLIVLQPKVLDLGWVAFYPLGAAVAMACLLIANRKAASLASPLLQQLLMAIFAALVLLVLCTLLSLTGKPQFALVVPSGVILAKCATVAFTASCGHWLIFLSTRQASAASTAPMMYVQLLIAMLIGYLWFATQPTPVMVLGATVIIASGIYYGWATAKEVRS